MKLDMLFSIIYGAALLFVAYFIYTMVRGGGKHRLHAMTNLKPDETPVYSENVWWPWMGGPYNYWPYWTSWYNSGKDGGYYKKVWTGGREDWNGSRPYGGSVHVPMKRAVVRRW